MALSQDLKEVLQTALKFPEYRNEMVEAIDSSIKNDGSNSDMQGHKISNLADPTSNQDAATKAYVDSHGGGGGGDIKSDGSVAFAANQSMGNHKLTNVTDPTSAQDAATKNYVDTHSGGSGANTNLSNLASPTSINQDLIFSADHIIKTVDKASGNSNSLSITTGDNSGTGRTGDITIQPGSPTTGSPGGVFVVTGVNNNGDRGNLQLNAGSIVIQSDTSDISFAGATSFTSGDINISGGNLVVSSLINGTQNLQMGNGSNASGTNSVAFGRDTTASNTYSFAIGRQTTASGLQSFAAGRFSTASASQSTSLGTGTKASGDSQTAVGTYNISVGSPGSPSASDELFAVGYGTGTGSEATAFSVLRDGTVKVINNSIVITTSKTPSSASDTGIQGQIAWDSSFMYVCVATDTWKRVAIATW